MPLTLFSTREEDRDKKEMANAVLKYQNQARPDCQQMPETENFATKLLKHFFGTDSGICFELLHGKKPAFFTKRVQKWSPEESHLSLKKVVVPLRVVNGCVERSLEPVTSYHIDRITRSEEQKFHLYQAVTKLRSKMKKIGEKKGLPKKSIKQMNYLL